MRHAALSDIDDGHRAAVTDVQWLPAACQVTESGALASGGGGMVEVTPPEEDVEEGEVGAKQTYQLMSCAADGTCLIWDIRGEGAEVDFKSLDLAWKPLVKVRASVQLGG